MQTAVQVGDPEALAEALVVARNGRAVVPINRITMKPFDRYPWGLASIVPGTIREMFEAVAGTVPLVGVALDSMENGVVLSGHNRDQYLEPKPTEEEIKEARRSRFDRVPDFAAFMQANHPRPPSIVGGIIRARDFVLLSGKAYSGKSWLTVELAVAVAGGSPWLGLPTTRTRVGIISREIEAADLQARFLTVLKRAGCNSRDLPVFPAVYPYIEGPVDLVDDLDGLAAFCERCELGLLILDPLSRLHSTDENSAEKLKPVLASVDALRERSGVAVVLCHHDRKGGQHKDADLDAPRGSSLLSTNPTVSIRLVELSGKMRRLTFNANHASTIEPIYLRPLEDGGFEVTDAPKKGAVLGEANRLKIIDALKEHGPQGYADLAKRTGIPERTVRHHARALDAATQVKKSRLDGNRVVLRLTSETPS